MDVVRRNIEALRGTILIDSEEGFGTTISIRLPLTLAIIDGFMMSVNSSAYVLPLDMVEECIELKPEIYANAHTRGYINLRGEVLPYIDLALFYGVVPSADGDTTPIDQQRRSLVVVPTMLVSAGEVLVGMPMSAVERVIELPDELMSVSGQPVFRDQGRTLPVRSLATVLGYPAREERIGIVVASPKPYILGVCLVEGTADLVIKPLTAMPARGIAGTARSAEGSLVLILDVAFLLAGGR